MKRIAIVLMILGGCDSGNGDNTTPTTLGTGDHYPALTIADCEGGAVDMQAKIAEHDVTYITFGAQWCTACAEEAPRINDELVDGLAGKSVGVAQILVEQQPGEPPAANLCASWRDELHAKYDVLVDFDQVHLAPFFGATEAGTLPVHLIVTRDGTIRSKIVGALPDDIQERIEAFLPSP